MSLLILFMLYGVWETLLFFIITGTCTLFTAIFLVKVFIAKIQIWQQEFEAMAAVK